MAKTEHAVAESPPSILVVDDQQSMRLLIRQVLSADGYRIEEAADGHEALHKFPEVKPDMVLLDNVMPGMDGIELCQRLKEQFADTNLPVLMITSVEEESAVERAFEAGVTDYVTKPINFAVLRQRVRYMLKAGRAEREVRRMAFHDALTGLPNRALLMDRLRHAAMRAARQKSMMAVMFLDLDRFKWVNDTLGHDAGDDLLRQISARLNAAARKSDTVARLGGDEFVVLMENLLNTQDVATVAQKVLDSIQAPMTLSNREVRVGGSIGIAVYPVDGYDADRLMVRADTAMYRAKESGRNRFQFYTAEMGEKVNRRLSMVSHLRNALERGDNLLLHFQPQIELRTGRMTMMEALVRWRHPEYGLLNAGEFLPLAEETGLVRQLDERVLRLVCEQLAAWRKQGFTVSPISVNFSGHHFREPGAAARIARILEETGALAENLVLEVSEHVTLGSTDSVELSLNAIKELGIGLCVDDFGVGQSSLHNLKRYPIDSLKIDARFTQGLGRDDISAVIVRGILALAREFNVLVIAEGVEHEDQLAALRELGCDFAQGFLLHQPFAPGELADVIARYPQPPG